jgi:hypothetical protein
MEELMAESLEHLDFTPGCDFVNSADGGRCARPGAWAVRMHDQASTDKEAVRGAVLCAQCMRDYHALFQLAFARSAPVTCGRCKGSFWLLSQFMGPNLPLDQVGAE